MLSTPHQQEKNVLYLSDLPTNLVQNDLDMFFEKYKDNIILISLDPKPRTIEYNQLLSAKVIFKTPETANTARIELNLRKIKGHAVRIMWEERDTSIRSNPKLNLFIKNIPQHITPREVYEHFVQYGDISSLKIPDDENGNHRGYGYLTYYSVESVETAMNTTNSKRLWNSNVELSYFQKRNERQMNFIPTAQRLYINNFPKDYAVAELNKLCNEYGKVDSCQMYNDNIGRTYAIVQYHDEESTKRALDALGSLAIGSNKLYVQIFQSKYERKQLLENKIRESNSRLNEQYRMCNLHIRNIPYHAKEDDLRKVFSKFGNIKSLKIDSYLLVTNEGKETKETLTSKGFGYVCYDNPESAKLAIEAYNGKFLPNYESWNRPLLIEYFMPKHERHILNNQQSTIANMGFTPGGMFYGGMRPPMMYTMPYMQVPPRNWHHRGGHQHQHQHQRVTQNRAAQPHHHQHNANVNGVGSTKRDVDMKYFNSLGSDEEKKDFLGEQIFKAIEESPIASKHNMDTQTIGRITGMIINIPDMNEVIEILKNENTLNMLINDGLKLLSNENKNK